MSSQWPVVWWYREVNCEVAEMCVEAVPVLGAEAVDFLFNWCGLKMDHIRHVPWCIGYHAQDFPLEAFQYFDVMDFTERHHWHGCEVRSYVYQSQWEYCRIMSYLLNRRLRELYGWLMNCLMVLQYFLQYLTNAKKSSSFRWSLHWWSPISSLLSREECWMAYCKVKAIPVRGRGGL
jgi:hypothetical protein